MSTAAGAAYLFDATTGAQLKKLTPNDPAADDRFGFSVALNSSTALIGAYYKTDAGKANSGAAYLFDATTGAQLKKLTPNDPAATDYFGHSVALNSSTALIGAYNKDNSGTRSGAAYLFDASSTCLAIRSLFKSSKFKIFNPSQPFALFFTLAVVKKLHRTS